MAMSKSSRPPQLRLAIIVKNCEPSEQFQIFLLRQHPSLPLPLPDSHDDVDLWELPSTTLGPITSGGFQSQSVDEELIIEAVSSVKTNLDSLGLKDLDVYTAVAQIQALVHPTGGPCNSWRYWKYVKDPDYGPGTSVHTIIFVTETYADDACFAESGHWVDPHKAYNMLVNADVKENRLGPLAMSAFSSHFHAGSFLNYDLSVHGQEYPPGIFVAPLDSATMRPFSKTNLVVIAPTASVTHSLDTTLAVASGDALICDPGCYPATAQIQLDLGEQIFAMPKPIRTGAEQLAKIVNELPKKLLIFVTHHHHDHIEGLPTVYHNNPEAIIIAHEKTIQRMGKGTAGLQCFAVEGTSKLLIAGQELEVISAPGHTDGHLGLFHRATGTLLVGDHCVGHGSSVLDANSGGNLEDYFGTCYRFLELAPKVIIPGHGYPTLWPMRMLHGYIRHREARQAKVLSAVQGGAKTAYQVVAQAYKDTQPAFWPAALMNVKLHIHHLQSLNQIPPDFDMEKFERSSRASFYLRCLPATASQVLRKPLLLVSDTSLAGGLSVVVVMGSVAYLWWTQRR